MAFGASAQAPTRSAVLELRQERGVVQEAYGFLDEKRLLLAAELLHELQHYESLWSNLQVLQAQATQALVQAIAVHGLHGLSVYPATPLAGNGMRVRTRSFMGVTLVESSMEIGVNDAGEVATENYPTPEARQCRKHFQALLQRGAELAGVSGNLQRLLVEYRKTERRARAIEDVILPEIEGSLKEMSERLEELDLEDAVRVRLDYGRAG